MINKDLPTLCYFMHKWTKPLRIITNCEENEIKRVKDRMQKKQFICAKGVCLLWNRRFHVFSLHYGQNGNKTVGCDECSYGAGINQPKSPNSSRDIFKVPHFSASKCALGVESLRQHLYSNTVDHRIWSQSVHVWPGLFAPMIGQNPVDINSQNLVVWTTSSMILSYFFY